MSVSPARPRNADTRIARRRIVLRLAVLAPVAAAAAGGAGVAVAEAASAARPGFDAADRGTWGNPSRNDPCPCGSGERFKHCHGQTAV